MKLSCNKLKELIKDENSAINMYNSYGLKSIANDERIHRDILIKKLQHCGK